MPVAALANIGQMGMICGVELASPSFEFKPENDGRARVPEPLPVRLIAVADVSADAVAGLEQPMDDFYVSLLEFARSSDRSKLVYHADNADLVFAVREPPIARDDLRPIAVEVPSLAVVESGLIKRELEYTRQRSIQPGGESILVQDPSGNWVEITERRAVA